MLMASSSWHDFVDILMLTIYLVANKMVENGGGCDRGLYGSISPERQQWPLCSHSNHLSWWSKDGTKPEQNEQENIIEMII